MPNAECQMPNAGMPNAELVWGAGRRGAGPYRGDGGAVGGWGVGNVGEHLVCSRGFGRPPLRDRRGCGGKKGL